MAFAGNVSTVTVTGEYVDVQGTPIAGQMIFRVPKALRNQVADQILIPSQYVVTLDANGRFQVVLPASNDPDWHETFEYTITESFAGGRTFSAVLPEALTYDEFDDLTYADYLGQTYQVATGTSYDISDLAPAVVLDPTFVSLAPYSGYVLLEARVTAAEASVDTTPPTTGIVLTLEYDSLSIQYADYTAMAGGLGSYTLLASTPILATSDAIAGFLVDAQFAQGRAEQAVLDVEAIGALYPHPFVFTGVA